LKTAFLEEKFDKYVSWLFMIDASISQLEAKPIWKDCPIAFF